MFLIFTLCFFFRQFKEQQRLNRQTESSSSTVYNRTESKTSDPGPPTRGLAGGYQPKHSLDIKSMQKEAVMSYIDRVGQTGVPRAGAPPETAPPPPPSSSPRRLGGASGLPRAPSASSRLGGGRAPAPAPPTTQPSTNFTVRREQVGVTLSCPPSLLGLFFRTGMQCRTPTSTT